VNCELKVFEVCDTQRQTNITKLSISAGEVYSTICVEWTVDHFGLGLT